MNSLKVKQMKYLKRVFHAPSSTPNAVTLLETGSLPIEQEIHVRQLNFLHHILTLKKDDPVKLAYSEQLKYTQEQNWGNEVKDLRKHYNIPEDDSEIEKFSKEKWKKHIKKYVKQHALEDLNAELSKLKHASQITTYNTMKPQQYFEILKPHHSRKLFHVRAGIVDIKSVRKYKYSDTLCRLCGDPDENIEHVLNHCNMIPRVFRIDNVFTCDREEMAAIAERFALFATKVNELERDNE